LSGAGEPFDSVAAERRPEREGDARTLIWQSFGVSYTGDARLEQTS